MGKGQVKYLVTSAEKSVAEIITIAGQCMQTEMEENGTPCKLIEKAKLHFGKQTNNGVEIKIISRNDLETWDRVVGISYCNLCGEQIEQGTYQCAWVEDLEIYMNTVWFWVQALREAIPDVQIKLKEI